MRYLIFNYHYIAQNIIYSLIAFYTLAVSGVLLSASPSISQAPNFGNISQTARTISIIFCMQLLFRMKRDDIKYRFGSKTMNGFFRKIFYSNVFQSQTVHYFYLPLHFFEIWNNVCYCNCAAIQASWNQNVGKGSFLFWGRQALNILIIFIYACTIFIKFGTLFLTPLQGDWRGLKLNFWKMHLFLWGEKQ